ncbi:MAG: DUF1036 domain-containing protein [Alphaproteobacteria bacterium]|nr:DUF1036 domain-containing protein [Alphaproteobacteria bacterium]
MASLTQARSTVAIEKINPFRRKSMKPAFSFPRPYALGFLIFAALACGAPREALAALSFCNRTTVAIEAALGYRADTDAATENFVSEGWWRIEPGQCARVYGQSLTQRFYFYYAHALAAASKDAPPTVWSGKYIFCTDDKAFRVEGDGDCSARKYQTTGFQELDLGPNVHDYTLDFREAPGK